MTFRRVRGKETRQIPQLEMFALLHALAMSLLFHDGVAYPAPMGAILTTTLTRI